MLLVTVVVGFAEGLWVLGHIGLGEIGKAVVEDQVPIPYVPNTQGRY